MRVRVEYKGQWVDAEVIRSFLFMRRVAIWVKGGYYRLVWVPKWRIK